MARFQKGEYERAIGDFDRVLRLNVGDPYALYGRGLARRRTGDVLGLLDMTLAVVLRTDIAEEMEQFGVR